MTADLARFDIDELNADFPPSHPRDHTSTESHARELTQILGVEYSSTFRMEVAIAITFTAAGILAGAKHEPDPYTFFSEAFADGEGWETAQQIVNDQTTEGLTRVLAVLLVSVRAQFKSTSSNREKDPRSKRKLEQWGLKLVRPYRRKPGRPTRIHLLTLVEALVDVALDHGASCALPSNQDLPENRPLSSTSCPSASSLRRKRQRSHLKRRLNMKCSKVMLSRPELKSIIAPSVTAPSPMSFARALERTTL